MIYMINPLFKFPIKRKNANSTTKNGKVLFEQIDSQWEQASCVCMFE